MGVGWGLGGWGGVEQWEDVWEGSGGAHASACPDVGCCCASSVVR